MKEIFLPTRHSFENGNTFSGSCGPLRFFLKPADGVITAELWHGLFCREKSELERTESFPLTDEGIDALRSFLTAQIGA
ncbi:MAG: hypothetical protein VB055_00325 [Oscillospiraceae bacterium]|nr:hypothetical protein [Oscillospiraceae bacterium]